MESEHTTMPVEARADRVLNEAGIVAGSVRRGRRDSDGCMLCVLPSARETAERALRAAGFLVSSEPDLVNGGAVFLDAWPC